MKTNSFIKGNTTSFFLGLTVDSNACQKRANGAKVRAGFRMAFTLIKVGR